MDNQTARKLVNDSIAELGPRFAEIDEIALQNQKKVLAIQRKICYAYKAVT